MSLLLLQIIANNYTWFFALIILINITIYVCIFQDTTSFLALLADGDPQLPPQKPKSRPSRKGKGKGPPTYSGSLRSQRSPVTSTVTSESQCFPISVTPLSRTAALVDTTPLHSVMDTSSHGRYSSTRPELAFMNTVLLDLKVPLDTPTVPVDFNVPLDSIDVPMQTPMCSPKTPSAGDDITPENFSDSTL